MNSVETWAAQTTGSARVPSATIRLPTLDPRSDVAGRDDRAGSGPARARPASVRMVIEFDLRDASRLRTERPAPANGDWLARATGTEDESRRQDPIPVTSLPFLAQRLAQDLSSGESALPHAAAEAAYRRGAGLTTRLYGNHAPVDLWV
ncbi:MAG: hypothetical protein EXQ87_08035 [Alphaproteobacteria bacterium]|nr:hypothetical protein [Alphaproteobacteria bacterium]